MADYPLEELGGDTPLEAAETPNMDLIASCRIGLILPHRPGKDDTRGYGSGQRYGKPLCSGI